jgi:general secretion pathway protein A
MYREFYGLKELPFALTPDPRFIYFTPSHTEAMANLHYGVESGKGLIVVTGEVGTGKTTILRWMMQRLDRAVLVGYVFNPRLTVPEFYQHVTRVLEVDEWETKSDLLFKLGKVLETRHARGLRTVLIIDEAHGLSTSVLEEIRLMSNFESDSAKLLQVVLTGQPELRDVLNDPALRQLKQRVALRCEIRPLPSVEETEKYIKSRLHTAGAERADIFTPEAVDFIYRCSEGIPRQINNLCDNALLAGFAAGEPLVTRALVEEVADTFDMLPRAATSGLPDAVEREGAARIFNERGRAELRAAGTGQPAQPGRAAESRTQNGSSQHADGSSQHKNGSSQPAEDDGRKAQPAPVDVSDVGAAFRRWDAMGER